MPASGEPPAPPPPEAESGAARLARLRHDLRTPLNHIIGYSEMLAEDAPPELAPDLARIRAAADALLARTDEALALLGEALDGRTAPAAPRASPTPAGSAPVRPDSAGEDATDGAALLVVDDDEANRDLLARRLRKHGFAVDVAADGRRALALIEERSYELVLLDIMMPGMSGIEVLRRIRERHPIAELPVIMATAKDASDDVVEALAVGANDYVTKPINLPVVIARTLTQLELRRAHEQIRALASQLEARKRFIRQTFGRYLTDEVVNRLLATPAGLALGGETRTVTVLMSDLRGFSSLAERLSPSQVITLLNHYLAAMTEIICRHGGTIDEFVGDAILVIFGAPTLRPDDARRAVACAIEMQLAMETVNEHNAACGLPHIEMGIGVNTGEVVVGNIGSERRAKYGVVGRNVNLASRIQGYSVGEQVLVSSSTLTAAGADLQVDGCVDVFPKGSKRPMKVYAIGGIGDPYGLELPRRAPNLTALARPVPVRFSVLDGIDAATPTNRGTLTHLSARAARLAAETVVAPMRTVRLEILRDDGAPVPGDAYGRVLTAADGGRLLSVHFTSLAPAVERWIAELLAGA